VAIRKTANPTVAARMARARAPLRSDWERVKDEVMRKAVRAKFNQHPALRRLLLSTGTASIVEHSENDRYWADGGNGRGLNRLGQILMEVRAELGAPTGEPVDLVKVWSSLLGEGGKSWALFENGTCVVLPPP